MTQTEKHIAYYNRLNGKVVRKSTLQKFLKKVSGNPELAQVADGLERAISGMGKDKVCKLFVKPITNSTSSLQGVDESLLYGLQNVQDDSEFEGKALGGFGDTTYKVITDRILELMKKDGLIWRKPWNEKVNGDTDLAHNYATKHVYRGGNYYLNFLNIYATPYFFSFKQVSKLGGKVLAGEKGWPVIYFKYLYKDLKKNKLVPEEEAVSGGKLKPGYSQIPGLFYYNVFNLDQTEGLKIKAPKSKVRTNKERIESAERIVFEMPKRPKIQERGTDAWYRRSEDLVQVPSITQFHTEQEYYSTLFHELIHSTGHPDRVYREREASRRFGDKNYAFEELIAELGASFLCGESGVLYFTMKNSAAYLKSWSGRLRKEMEADPKFFIRAASKAQTAADFILARGEYEKLKKKKKAFKPKAKKEAVLKESNRPPVKRKVVNKKKTAKKSKSSKSGMDGHPTKKRKDTVVTKKPAHALAGFTTADKVTEAKNLFTLPGPIGEFLGVQQRYRLQIILDGQKHSSKSELAKQIADAFIDAGFETAYIDYEHGGLINKDTQAGINRNLKQENRSKLQVSDEDFPTNIEALKNLAASGNVDVIIIDSGSKIQATSNIWLDELRTEFSDIIWVVLMQQNSRGETKGGTSAGYNAPVIIKTYRPDKSNQLKNYAELEKNRGNRTDLYYIIAEKKVVNYDPSDPPPTPVQQPAAEVV
jgi:antirestriction protein ArdC